MMKLTKLILRAVFVPWKNSEFLQKELTSGLWTRSLLGLLFFGLAFSLTSIIQAATGNFPGVPIILPLGLENYFVWQAILIIPWLIVSWLLVSFLAKSELLAVGARKVSFRQLSASLALSFYPFLFWLWLPHLLTAVFYLLGMSQKEWVDLLSEPGWFQTLYLAFLILAISTGLLATTITIAGRKWVKRGLSWLTAILAFVLWSFLIFILLR
ncbi:MAG TPA: hypothetical protein ENO29_07485 [Candidatus Aminicenantes bacterium]|nr:MAG: hypothetical protein C0168_06495 [Candidatus Aminicenantes bacterium]HEK86178.1 hypothetical protein [Candidatus Aminicenantes bacterium]